MKNPWVKLWRNTLNDEKVAFLMRRYGHECLTFWVGLLTKAEDGVLLMDEEIFSDMCLLEDKRYQELRAVFVKRGLVDLDESGRMIVAHWDDYQVGESTERVRRFRDAKRQEGAAQQANTCNENETQEKRIETKTERSEGEGELEGEGEEEGEGERASAAPPHVVIDQEKATPAAVVADWHAALADLTGAGHIDPPPKAEAWAVSVVAFSGGSLSKAKAMRAEYFAHWRDLWFATCKADKSKPVESRAPDFDFRAYCANAQQLAARLASKTESKAPRAPLPKEPPPTTEEQAAVAETLGQFTKSLEQKRRAS